MKKEYEYKTYMEVWKSAYSLVYWLKGRKGVYILLEAITRIAYNEGYEKGKKLQGLGPINSDTVTSYQ